MAYKSLREWMEKLEKAGQLKRITAEVDWDLEMSAITRRIANRGGPALLYENIKGYKNTLCRKVFENGLGSREKIALSLSLPMDTSYREIINVVKERIVRLVEPVKVASGPVKQNIVRGDAVNLYEFPAPRYNKLDGGRYINTRGCCVTMDPDTKILNVGLYRGMIGEKGKSIPVLMIPNQHWGRHWLKHKQRGDEMPVAVVYGWDPILVICASFDCHPTGHSEYEVVGGLRGEPVELVKCETSDLYVPATAEIVVEGRMSADPKTFELEGPFGEYPGFYGGQTRPRPTIRVDCITYRNDPIFRGGLCGADPSGLIEVNHWLTPFKLAQIWESLEATGVPNITGIWGDLVTHGHDLRISIDKIYRGHAKQVAAAFWGLKSSRHAGKILTVVDKDIDVFDDEAMAWARVWRSNADLGAVQFFSGTAATPLDPSVPLSQRDELKYGEGKWTRVFIDATVNWELEIEKEYAGMREPPRCTEITPETAKLITRRWKEYGLEGKPW